MGCPSPPVRNDMVTPRHLFTKVTIIKSRLRIATYLYSSIFVSSPYVICSRDGVIVRVSLSALAVLTFFYCTGMRKRLQNLCVLISVLVSVHYSNNYMHIHFFCFHSAFVNLASEKNKAGYTDGWAGAVKRKGPRNQKCDKRTD